MEKELKTVDVEVEELDELFGEVELIEIDETITLSETAASSGISSCNSCSCCAST
ncbi:thiazolylpeptide-type bacteriocin, partial [Enterococcus faecalis]